MKRVLKDPDNTVKVEHKKTDAEFDRAVVVKLYESHVAKIVADR